MTVISYPIPPYSNVPIHAEYFQPSRFVISAVALGINTTFTTTNDLNYVIGQQVRILIPPSFGCTQLNETQGYVTSIPSANQVVVTINSSVNVDPFIASSAIDQPQILAIGDINSGHISFTGRSVPTVNGNTHTQIPGSFINISPF